MKTIHPRQSTVPTSGQSVTSPPNQSPGGSAPPLGSGGGSVGPRLSYRDLAWWAESADGDRDGELVVAECPHNGSSRCVVKKKDDAIADGDRILIGNIWIDPEVERSPVDRILIEVDGQTIDCRSVDNIVCDSVFCSESAIQKFLFPYYHSQRLLTPEQWRKLTAEFQDPMTVAIGHVHPSTSVTLRAGHGAGWLYGLKVKQGAPGVAGTASWVSLLP
jgi:hypothetical protein